MSYFVKDGAISFGGPPEGETGWAEYPDLASALSAVPVPEPELQPDWSGFLDAIRLNITLPIMDSTAAEQPTLHSSLTTAFVNENPNSITKYWNAMVALSPAFVAALNADLDPANPGHSRADEIRILSPQYNLPVELDASLNLVQL